MIEKYFFYFDNFAKQIYDCTMEIRFIFLCVVFLWDVEDHSSPQLTYRRSLFFFFFNSHILKMKIFVGVSCTIGIVTRTFFSNFS